MNIIRVPWPSKILSPNARAHYLTKGKATKTNRALCAYLGHGPRKRLEDPVLAILPIVDSRHRRDIDNALAGLKSTLDGLTDAGWWADDHDIVELTILRPSFVKAWGKCVVIAADEAVNQRELLFKVRDLAVAIERDPDAAWNDIGGPPSSEGPP